jgi:formiminoglutamase
MELKHYFDAVDFNGFMANSRFNRKYALGSAIEKNTLALADNNLSKVDVALIGLPLETVDNDTIRTAVPDRIRKELYQLAGLGKLNVIDLGNLKQAQSHKGNYLALRDIVDYLTEMKITCLVLGGSQDLSYGICEAFQNNKFFTFSVVDAFLDIKKGSEGYQPDNYLSRIFSSHPSIFGFNLIGYQRHYVPDKLFSKVKGVGTHIGLGQLRNDLVAAEPAMRNSDFVSFDFGTLRYSEAFGKHRLPNGLFADEVCQLARYAGLSQRLKVCGMFEVTDQQDSVGINVQLAAQAAWYFLEAVTQRAQERPEDQDGFVIRKVEVWQVETPLVFYENSENGQWWMRLQAHDNTFVYLACSEDDFIDASRNEIPEIWLKYVQKIDELLK